MLGVCTTYLIRPRITLAEDTRADRRAPTRPQVPRSNPAYNVTFPRLTRFDFEIRP